MSCISRTKVMPAVIAGDAELLTEIFNEVTSGLVVIDRHGLVAKVNASATLFLGKDLVGQKWALVVKQFFAPQDDDGNEVSLKDGRRVLVATKPLSIGQLVVLTDVTTTRNLQARVSHMERLSSLGRMAASLAHQIRTPLSAAMLYAANLGNKCLTESARNTFSRKLVDRLTDLENQVRDILLFARTGDKIAEKLEVTDLINSIKTGAEGTLIKSGAHLVVRMDEPPMEIIGSSTALASAVNNLINNAVEAGATQVLLDVRKDARQVTLKIADNGSGMGQELTAKSFEPFYTTKSNGTGLGLAVVRSVVEAHQGQIGVVSAQGRGTCFTITLPLVLPESKSKVETMNKDDAMNKDESMNKDKDLAA